MGSRGIRRRKRARHLPKIHHLDGAELGEPSPLTPAGVIRSYGKIARALDDPDRSRRRAGWVLYSVIALPLLVLLLGLVIAAVHG